MSEATTKSQKVFEAAADLAEAKYRLAEAKQMHKFVQAIADRKKAMETSEKPLSGPQPPAHHFDPDMADAILLAMLDNPHHAHAIANLSDDDLNQIAAEVPLDDDSDGQTNS